MLAGYAGTIAAMGFFSVDAYGFGGCTPSTGPDVIVGALNGISNYATVSGMDAFSIGTTSCNIGSVNLLWQASNANHPVIPQNMYRLKTVSGGARFEQIGQSWMKHAFTALTENLCCTCNGQGNTVLGVGCSDPYTAGRNGTQLTTVGGLGPKYQVNAHTGGIVMPYAFRNVSHIPHSSTTRRLQVLNSDLVGALNPGAQFFGEAHYVTPDDASNQNQNNNASYQQVTFTGTTEISASLTGSTQQQKPAIKAWKVADPSVSEFNVNVPEATTGDTTSLMILSSNAYNLGGGQWRYEYALYNMNSDRSGKSFSVPLPAGAVVTNIGFHDVPYHSGDGFNSAAQVQGTFGYNYDGTDWPGVAGASDVAWTMVNAVPVENSNALRWATLYNFRFDCDLPPVSGSATIGLFKAVAGLPDTVLGGAKVPALDCNNNNIADLTDLQSGTSLDLNGNSIPDECEVPQTCTGDIAPVGGNGAVDVDDLLAVINAWGACANPNDCPADIAPAGGNDVVNVDDLLAIINAWGPCPK
jgi:hypothetical protein